MSARTWSIISIGCFIGAIIFWKIGDSLLEKKLLTQNNNTFPLISTDYLSSTNSLITNKTANIEAFSHFDPQFSWRLRNTEASLEQLRKSATAILLRNALIDTRSTYNLQIPDQLRSKSEPGAFIIQFQQTINPTFLERIKQLGLTPISFIPNNAYLVSGSLSQAEQARRLPYVRAVIAYEPYFKLHPSLLTNFITNGSLPTAVRLTVFTNEINSFLSTVTNLVDIIEENGQNPFGYQYVVASITKPLPLCELAHLPQVQLIEPILKFHLMNDLLRTRMGVTSAPNQTNTYFGLSGSNIWININDTGVDATHPDLKERIFASQLTAFSDPLGHGTHVAGTIAGSGMMSFTVTNPPPGSYPDSSYQGIAPAAKLFVMQVDPNRGPLYPESLLQRIIAATNYLTLLRTNVLISNNSWGYTGIYDYDSSAASYDAAVRDALPELPGEQPVLFVFAAGNEGNGNDDGLGGDPGTITSPATAKNVITVGAIENLRFLTNQLVRTNADQSVTTNLPFYRASDSNYEVASISGRGNIAPGIEGEWGRFKPDLVAPGTFVVSTRSIDWDENLLPNSVIRYVISNQVISPNRWSIFSVYVPSKAHLLSILLQTNIFSRVPLLGFNIYLRAGDYPTINDIAGNNHAQIQEPTPGIWFYAVENSTLEPVSVDIVIEIEVQTMEEDWLAAVKELNETVKPYYRFHTGTSSAAAAVSGLLALIQEFFQSYLNQSPSPTLLKALLINRAHSVNPIYDLAVRKTINYQGWGVPELPYILPEPFFTNTANPRDWPIRWIDQSPTNAITTGQVHVYRLKLPEQATQADLKITLVWTDPPANPIASYKLVNDLDLIVSNVVTGVVYVGNDIIEGTDYNIAHSNTNLTELPYDTVNNVENVFIRRPVDTEYIIYVVGRQINVNAVTAHPDGIAQDYALVVSTFSPYGIELSQEISSSQSMVLPEVTVITNGIPLVNQRVGANSPLKNYPIGETNQWRFYVFTNAPMPDVPTTLTNGPYVAFITFSPPNLSTPRATEADIDLYVSRGDSRLLSLDPVAIANAYKSTERGGTEMVVFTNATIGEVFYVAVKAEDQMSGEYGLIGLSSVEPFGYIDESGNIVLRGINLPAAIPDGSPERPGATQIFAVGPYPADVGKLTVHLRIFHQQLGDLIGDLYHENKFAVLYNHRSGNLYPTGVLDEVYDDSMSGEYPLARTSDGPGSLLSFVGTKATGPWIFTVIDNALGQTGRVEQLEIRIRPNPDLIAGYFGTLAPNQFELFFIDVPTDATKMRVILSSITGPINVYARYQLPPTLEEYDKVAFLNIPGGELIISRDDIPPLTPGKYYIALFNPTAKAVDYHIRVEFERNLDKILSAIYETFIPTTITDDALILLTNTVDINLPVSEVQVGLRVDHPRVSDLAFYLISPYGTRTVLVENRGGTNATKLGTDLIRTNFHHLAFVYEKDLGRINLYLNGNSIISKIVGDIELDTTGHLYVGHQPLTNLPPSQFYGSIDEVELISRALLPPEILALFKFGPQAKPINGLVGWWQLDGDGKDAIGTNDAVVLGGSFEAGQFNQALMLHKAGDGIVISNYGTFDIGNKDFTLDLWFSPWHVDTNATLIVWSDVTNKLGLEIGLKPNPTNGMPPLLYVNLRDKNGQLLSLETTHPTLALSNLLTTNIVYLTLTDNTNLAAIPIKFANLNILPYVYTNVLLSDFEHITANPATKINAGAYGESWLVESNYVVVLANPSLAHTGTNLLYLCRGSILTNLTLETGATYELRFAHRAVPMLANILFWWPGTVNPENSEEIIELIKNHSGKIEKGVFPVEGVVDKALLFATPTSAVEIPHDSKLNLTNEFTIEFWLRLLTTGRAGYLISKIDPLDSEKVNFALSITNNQLLFWFNDPTTFGLDSELSDGKEGIIIAPEPSDGKFHHIAVSAKQVNLNQVEIKAYIDGKLMKAITLRGSLANGANNGPVRIGATIPEGIDGFRGIIDELTFYSRALDESEIQLIYSLNAVGKGTYPPYPVSSINISTQVVAYVHSSIIWQTNVIQFVATTNTTTIKISAIIPGMLLDSIELVRIPTTYYLPEEPLSPFIGQPAAGNWVLEIRDRRTGPTDLDIKPELISWKLELKFAPPQFPAIPLTNGIPYTNTIQQGEARYFYVDVPRSANRATNSLISHLPLSLWFNQNGIPQFNITNQDIPLLIDVTNGIVTITTNGIYWLSPTNTSVVIDSSTYPILLPGQRYYLGLTNSGPPTTFIICVEFDTLDTNILGIVDLVENQTVQTNIAPGNIMHYYRYNVSEQAIAVSFELYPQNGDLNLYVRKAVAVPDPLPRPNAYDYASENPGIQPEIIVVSTNSYVPLSPGYWYLGVLNLHTNPVDYSIRVVESRKLPVQIIPLEFNQPIQTSSDPALPFNKYFKATIPPNVNNFEIRVEEPDQPVSVYLRKGAYPTDIVYDLIDKAEANYSARLIVTSNPLVPSIEGDWYVAIAPQIPQTVNFNILLSQTPTQPFSIMPGQFITATIGNTIWGAPPPIDYYVVELSPNVTRLSLVLRALSGNAMFTVKYGSKPTEQVYDYQSIRIGNLETLVIDRTSSPNPLQPGKWYIGVQNLQPFSTTYRLIATVETEPQLPEMKLQIPVITDSGHVRLNWTASPGLYFRIEYSDQMPPQQWLPLIQITSSTGNYSFEDDGTLTGGLPQARFYRIVLVPIPSP